MSQNLYVCATSQCFSPLECLIPSRKERNFKNNNNNSILFNGIHPTGQEFPYRSGKKILSPFLNIAFHTVNPSESLLWNE